MQPVGSSTVVFDADCKYVTSYLLSPRLLGYLRLLFGIYALTTTIFSLVWEGVRLDEADVYFAYFTHLSFVGIMAWFFASAVQSLCFDTAAAKNGFRYPLQSRSKVLQFLHESLFCTIATFPIIVTVIYWALLSSPESFITAYDAWGNITQHILNLVFVLCELFFTNLPPLPWIQLPITIIILGAYLGVAYLTHATQGFYTYSFLNPQGKSAILVAYIVGIAVGQVILFVVVRYLIVLRERILGKVAVHAHIHQRKGEKGCDVNGNQRSELV